MPQPKDPLAATPQTHGPPPLPPKKTKNFFFFFLFFFVFLVCLFFFFFCFLAPCRSCCSDCPDVFSQIPGTPTRSNLRPPDPKHMSKSKGSLGVLRINTTVRNNALLLLFLFGFGRLLRRPGDRRFKEATF